MTIINPRIHGVDFLHKRSRPRSFSCQEGIYNISYNISFSKLFNNHLIWTTAQLSYKMVRGQCVYERDIIVAEYEIS